MKRVVGGVLILGSLFFSGCASIVSDSSYPVTINASPEGVRYKIKNAKRGYDVMAGVTPATISLSAENGFFSKASYLVTFEKPGYESVTLPLKAGMDGWYIGNLLFGGILGFLIIDPATGAMWKLEDHVQVALSESIEPANDAAVESDGAAEEKPELGAAEDADELTVLMIDQVPDAYRDRLVRIN